MLGDRQVARIEWGVVGLSLALLLAGIAELNGAIDVAPVAVYVAVLWLLALGLWILRREYG